ncbi:hypothetical protein C3F09_03290 [candidate division GN15 bacterium]|uniref:Uncharacterized protein n=1 Tax=candidate division GN15 bacterium TaxID=2072418 RepID=A0A855X8U9_9BACT|nr:MAG: hypothetical protein C3F09_03290 [candidate division GN15 bacterium]
MTVRILVPALIALVGLLGPGSAAARGIGDAEADSVRVHDSLRAASGTQRTDTVRSALPDSLREKLVPPAPPPVVVRTPRFSSFDTLITYFTSDRLSQKKLVAQSYIHDAGNYFRADPGFVELNYIITPMRKTVKPYNLSGNHLGVMENELALEAFDHVPEPDGLPDMDDVPTELDNDIFILPGVMGTLFGSRHNVATLLTRPIRPTPREAHSALLVDKGSYGFSYARAKYERSFANGRSIDLGLGYRNGAGYGLGYGDTSYAYDADILLPLGDRSGVRATGHLYNRGGYLAILSPDTATFNSRDRFDRSARVLFETYGSDGRSRSSFGYTHLRQGSSIGPDQPGEGYKGRFDITGHGVVGKRQWLQGKSVISISAEASRIEYDNAREKYARYHEDISIVWARPLATDKIALTAGVRSAERFGLMPNLAVVWKRESSGSMWLATVGYSEREPSLHELHLPIERAVVYDHTTGYAEIGNPNLGRERQMVGSIRGEVGTVGNSLAASVVGGRIWDAIDWRPTFESESGSLVFSPVNDNITFATATLTKDIQLLRLFSIRGGASYHYLDYASGRAKAYQPDYQAFGGGEFHVFWKQRLIHLYAYGEAVYLGPFDGYRQTGLGERVVFNTKVSFSMGNFQFYLVNLNVFNTVYADREYDDMPGNTLFWGFVWNFLD